MAGGIGAEAGAGLGCHPPKSAEPLSLWFLCLVSPAQCALGGRCHCHYFSSEESRLRAAHLLIVLYLVREPDYLSLSDGVVGGKQGAVGLKGGRGLYAGRQRSQSKLSWFTLRASAASGQGLRLHAPADPAVPGTRA